MLNWIFSWWTLGGIGALLAGGALFLTISGLWPVVIATLSTPAGRKAALIAAGGFALWLFSLTMFQRGKKAANDALKANSARLEEQRTKTDAELKNLPADELVKRGNKWLRD